MYLTTSFIALFLIAAALVGSGAHAAMPQTAHELQRELREHPDRAYVVEFYAPWCGACNAFEPEWMRFASAERRAERVNCEENRALCAHFNIEAYPTVKYVNADGAHEYRGPQTANGLAEWVGQQAPAQAAHNGRASCAAIRKAIKRILASDAQCEASWSSVASDATLLVTCAFDPKDAVRASFEGRRIDSVLVREMPRLSVLLQNRVELDMDQALSGLLVLKLPTVNINALVCM